MVSPNSEKERKSILLISSVKFGFCSFNPGRIKSLKSLSQETSNFDCLFNFLQSNWFFFLSRLKFAFWNPGRARIKDLIRIIQNVTPKIPVYLICSIYQSRVDFVLFLRVDCGFWGPNRGQIINLIAFEKLVTQEPLLQYFVEFFRQSRTRPWWK